MKKTTSPKQVAANRANAQKSTGPRTPEGKEASRLNAWQHGILSDQVLVHGLALDENEAEFDGLHQRFWMQYQPEGPTEEMLVDQIVTTHWRLGRVLKAEAGEIALSMDVVPPERQPLDPMLQWMMWEQYGDPVPQMERSLRGVKMLRSWLRELKETVEAAGGLTAEMVAGFRKSFGDKANRLTLELEAVREGLKGKPKAEQQPVVLAWLDLKLEGLERKHAECLERDTHEVLARKAAGVLPGAAVLERIGRYEGRLQRQLFRAMRELRVVQKERREVESGNIQHRTSNPQPPEEEQGGGRGRSTHQKDGQQEHAKTDLSKRSHLEGSDAEARGCGEGAGVETSEVSSASPKAVEDYRSPKPGGERNDETTTRTE